MRQKISVRAIIRNNEKILLLKRATGNPLYVGQLELPGGKVEYGEDPVMSVRREVGEEIGVDAGITQLHRVVSWLDTVERDTQHIIIVYLVSLANPEAKLVLSSEHDKYEWVELSQIQLNELNMLTRIVLEDELKETVPDMKLQNGRAIVDNSTTESDAHKVIIYTDGGSRGNPGPSASGFVIYSAKGDLLYEGGDYLGITTNNQAEYQAVKSSLDKAAELDAHVIDFRLDSELVANQLTGAYQVKNRDLWPIHVAILELTKKFKKVTFTHVQREFNREADAMVNKILNEHQANA